MPPANQNPGPNQLPANAKRLRTIILAFPVLVATSWILYKRCENDVRRQLIFQIKLIINLLISISRRRAEKATTTALKHIAFGVTRQSNSSRFDITTSKDKYRNRTSESISVTTVEDTKGDYAQMVHTACKEGNASTQWDRAAVTSPLNVYHHDPFDRVYTCLTGAAAEVDVEFCACV